MGTYFNVNSLIFSLRSKVLKLIVYNHSNSMIFVVSDLFIRIQKDVSLEVIYNKNRKEITQIGIVSTQNLVFI